MHVLSSTVIHKYHVLDPKDLFVTQKAHIKYKWPCIFSRLSLFLFVRYFFVVICSKQLLTLLQCGTTQNPLSYYRVNYTKELSLVNTSTQFKHRHLLFLPDKIHICNHNPTVT